MIRSLNYLAGKIERLEVTRNSLVMIETKEMLLSYGFKVKTELHLGFWLIHWSFPGKH